MKQTIDTALHSYGAGTIIDHTVGADHHSTLVLIGTAVAPLLVKLLGGVIDGLLTQWFPKRQVQP